MDNPKDRFFVYHVGTHKSQSPKSFYVQYARQGIARHIDDACIFLACLYADKDIQVSHWTYRNGFIYANLCYADPKKMKTIALKIVSVGNYQQCKYFMSGNGLRQHGDAPCLLRRLPDRTTSSMVFPHISVKDQIMYLPTKTISMFGGYTYPT